MDIEKLIEKLKNAAGGPEGIKMCHDAATTISALQAENAQLRVELEYEQEHANAYHEECEQWEAENEKLRAEIEQMTACIYYKPGGLCRYGGDDPANVCVFGPCPHEVSAQEFLSELENVKRERDAAVNAIRTWRFCESCKFGGTPMNYDCLGCYRASKWVWNGQKEG